MLYSAKKNGFFSLQVHGKNVPDDAVEISADLYSSLLLGQSEGNLISSDSEGMPILIEPPPYVPTADDQRAAVAEERYTRETSGVEVEGMAIDTGRDSQALLTGAALQAMLDPEYSVRWKTAGGFVELDAQQIIDLASAVRAHVQTCFDREAELLEAIDAGTYSAEMLDEGWPQ